MNFVAVDQALDFDYLRSDGILGLSPKEPKSDPDGINLFVRQLYKQKVLEKPMFALKTSDKNTLQPSMAHFGGYDESIIEKANTKIDPSFIGDRSKILNQTDDGIFW